MLTVLIILILAALLFGGWGSSRYGYAGWSPLAVVILVLIILYLTGYLR